MNALSTMHQRHGVLWMLFAMLLFSGVNATAKHLATTLPVVEALWARYLFHGVVLVVLLGRRLPAAAKSVHLPMQLLRSVLTATTTGLIFLAVHLLTLVEVSAIMLLTPLILTVLAIPLLGEAAGPRRLVAVLVGFGGALVIIRPGSGVFQLASMVPLCAALSMSLFQIATRFSGRRDSVLTSVVYTPLVGIIATSAAMPFIWVQPSPAEWGFMLWIGLLGATAQWAQIRAFTVAPAAVVAPMLYTGLIWATLLDLWLFSAIPDSWTIAGALIITLSGLYVWHRERAVAGAPH